MLKCQDNYTTEIETFEDFILIVYVIIDDLYKEHVPSSVSNGKRISAAKLSDSEIITISLCGELLGMDSENAWYQFVKKNYLYLFPNLCSRSRFNRTRRALLQVTDLLRQKLSSEFDIGMNKYFIIDSFPLEVCKFGRAHFCKAFRCDGANFGKCPSKKETYFGYKVHALITLEGFITDFEVTPASTDDREGLRDIVDSKSDIIILAGKGYIGEKFNEDMENQGVSLLPLKRDNCKNNWSKPVRQLIFRFRRRVETVFSQLSEQLNSERVLAKSFRGLCTRLLNKVLAYNLCLLINRIFKREFPISNIKNLIF